MKIMAISGLELSVISMLLETVRQPTNTQVMAHTSHVPFLEMGQRVAMQAWLRPQTSTSKPWRMITQETSNHLHSIIFSTQPTIQELEFIPIHGALLQYQIKVSIPLNQKMSMIEPTITTASITGSKG